MGSLDRGAKIVLQYCPEGLVETAWPGTRLEGREANEVVTSQLLMDRVFVGERHGEKVTLDLEFKAEPASDVGYQVARYACGLFWALGRPVLSTVFYLHPAADARRPRARYTLPVGEDPAPLRFREVAFWRDLDALSVLARPVLGLLPFVGLMKNGDLEQVRLGSAAITRLAPSPEVSAELQASLYLLCGYRFPRGDLLGIISKEALMESVTYRATLEEGHKEGHKEGRLEQLRETVLRQLGARLSRPVPEELAGHIRAAGRLVLDAVSLLLVDVSLSDRDLLERVEQRLSAPRTESEDGDTALRAP